MRSKKALINVVFSLCRQAVAIICGFIVPRLIIKTYGSDVNGLIASVTQFLAYITLLEAGIGPVIKSQLYNPIAKKDKQEIVNILYASESYFRKIALIFIVYIILLLVFYPMLVNTSFSRSFSSLLLLIIAISSFAEYFFGMTYSLFLHSDQKSYIISIIQTGTTILNTIIIVILALFKTNILIVKLFSSLVFVIRPLAQMIYVKTHYKLNFSKADKNYKLKNRWDGLAQHIAAIVYTNTDVAVLTVFTSVIQVSIYSVYYLVTSSLQKIIQSISDGIDASFGNLIAKKEQKRFQNAFEKYEIIYYTIIALIYSCAFSLIIPFVRAYTSNIHDANYVLPAFGFIMILCSYIYAIKIPYHSLVKTIGHFKQTKFGAWVEAIVNLLLSIILVSKYGLLGVAIGTLVATTIRTIELIIYSEKNIVQISVFNSIKKIIICSIEVLLIVICCKKVIINISFSSLMIFIKYAVVVFIISAFFILLFNILFVYRKQYLEILHMYILKLRGDKNEK